MAPDVFDTLTTHSGFVRDVTDTDFLAQNGSTVDHVFGLFHTLIFINQDQKSKGINKLFFFFSFFFFSTITIMSFSLGRGGGGSLSFFFIFIVHIPFLR